MHVNNSFFVKQKSANRIQKILEIWLKAFVLGIDGEWQAEGEGETDGGENIHH